MNSDQENFDQLRALLKLKRYEKPHPRYFNNFSSQVIARIKDGQRTKDNNLLDWITARLLQMQSLFENKPSIAWGIVGACSTVLVATVVFTEGGQPMAQADAPVVASVLSSPSAAATPVAFTMSAEAGGSNEIGGSLFDQIRPSAMPASWQP